MTSIKEILIVLVILCQTVASKQINEIYINTTNGASGIKCPGASQRCITQVTQCDGRQCVCPPGERGQNNEGRFECNREDEHLCVVTGDPHIHAFNGDRVDLNLPCRYRLARFVSLFVVGNKTSFGRCSIEIFGTNSFFHDRYYVRTLDIVAGLTDSGAQGFSLSEIIKIAESDAINGVYQYKYIVNKTQSDHAWGSGEKLNITILTKFDADNNFAVIDMVSCGVRLKIRAYDKGKSVQVLLPGISIVAPDHSTFVKGYGDYPKALCGAPDGSSIKPFEEAHNLKLRNPNTAVVYDILNQQIKQEDHPMAEACYSSNQLFKDSKNKVEDVDSCAFVLTTGQMGKCLKEVSKVEPIEVFNHCMSYRANPEDHSACAALKKASGDCPKGWQLQNLSC